jgi:hypothetical protein
MVVRISRSIAPWQTLYSWTRDAVDRPHAPKGYTLTNVIAYCGSNFRRWEFEKITTPEIDEYNYEWLMSAGSEK